jgi:hypothetical protein
MKPQPNIIKIKPENFDDKKRNSESSSSSSISEENTRIMIERSPSFEKRRLQHKWEVAEKKYQNKWESCCFTCDRRAVMYFTQIGIISFTMLFCVYQLTSIDSCESSQTYVGLLTMMLGIALPQPKFSDKEKD